MGLAGETCMRHTATHACQVSIASSHQMHIGGISIDDADSLQIVPHICRSSAAEIQMQAGQPEAYSKGQHAIVHQYRKQMHLRGSLG